MKAGHFPLSPSVAWRGGVQGRAVFSVKKERSQFVGENRERKEFQKRQVAEAWPPPGVGASEMIGIPFVPRGAGGGGSVTCCPP
jgi:hypothetical protein